MQIKIFSSKVFQTQRKCGVGRDRQSKEHVLLTYLGRNLFYALFPSALDELLFCSMLLGNMEITPFSMEVAWHN